MMSSLIYYGTEMWRNQFIQLVIFATVMVVAVKIAVVYGL